MIHLDFETFSEVDIKAMGAHAYAASPSTKVLIACYAIDDGPVRIAVPPEVYVPVADHFKGYTVERGFTQLQLHLCEWDQTIAAHNAEFEREILSRVWGMPRSPEGYYCTAALSSALSLPSNLKGAAQFFGSFKDEAGTKLINYFSTPKGGVVRPEDDVPEFIRYVAYCVQDVEAEREVHRAIVKLLTPEEIDAILTRWRLTVRMNERGIAVDMPSIHRAIAQYERQIEAAARRYRELTGHDITQNAEAAKYFGLPNVQEATRANTLLTMPEGPRKDAMLLKHQTASTAPKKLYTLRDAAIRGRVHGGLKFHGATTGRWSGRIYQPQNFKRASPEGKAAFKRFLDGGDLTVDEIALCIRHFLVGPFLDADFSSIEARVLAWLAGEQWKLDAFAKDEDLYCVNADGIYGRKVERGKKSIERLTGKVAELALGYQGGIGAFANMARIYSLDLLPLMGSLNPSPREVDSARYCYGLYHDNMKGDVLLDEEEGIVADVIKQRWRAKNARIVEFWSEVEQAMRDGGKLGRLEFGSQRGFRYIRLPSGRRMFYPKFNPAKMQYYSNVQGRAAWGMVATYGGKITENVCQAVSYDLMAEAMLNLEAEGYENLLTVHDQTLGDGRGYDEFDVDAFTSVMERTPAWADGLPLKVVTEYTQRYE